MGIEFPAAWVPRAGDSVGINGVALIPNAWKRFGVSFSVAALKLLKSHLLLLATIYLSYPPDAV
jgi:hypothetical protein